MSSILYHWAQYLGRWCSYRSRADLAELAADYGIKLHAYADDSQLLIHCEPNMHAQTSAESLEQISSFTPPPLSLSVLRAIFQVNLG